MPMTDAALYVHGTGTSAFGPITNTAGVIGDAVCWAGTNGSAGSVYSNNEIDFGTVSTGSTFPYIGEFPSIQEKGYTTPPAVVGEGGVIEGFHFIIGSAFTVGGGCTGIAFSACTSLTTNATTQIGSRTLTLAQLAVVGAHYFMPILKSAVLEFLRWYAVPGTANPAAGTLVSWWGPKTGGEL